MTEMFVVVPIGFVIKFKFFLCRNEIKMVKYKETEMWTIHRVVGKRYICEILS